MKRHQQFLPALLFGVIALESVIFLIPQAFSNMPGKDKPVRWDFIIRNGNILMDNGKPFRFAGMNIHWLGLDDPQGGSVPSLRRIDEAFNAATAMKATVVRSHSLGISVSCKNCIEPTLNQWNDSAFNTIDYSIMLARKHHIRLVIPLIDNWHYPQGGKHNFTEWEGDKKEDNFYSNPRVIADFKTYITHVLNHVNQYTGVALKNDPAIMAWETGNELDNTTGKWDDKWTEGIAEYIKSIAPHQLVLDGHANYHGKGNLTASQLQLPSVDLYSGHFYPPQIPLIKEDARLAKQFNKAYFIGEYDWTDYSSVQPKGTIRQDGNEKADGLYSAHVNVSQKNPIYSYYIQLGQSGLSLAAGQTYKLTFSAKASFAHNIEVALQQSDYPYLVYSRHEIALTPDWHKYTYVYTPTESHPLMYIWYNLAQDTGDIWLDEVSLLDGNINLLKNGSFEQTGNNWLFPWIFKVKKAEGSGDKLEKFLSAVETNDNISGDLFWQLYGHDDKGGWRKGDPYTLHYPDGDGPEMQKNIKMLIVHARKMRQ